MPCVFSLVGNPYFRLFLIQAGAIRADARTGRPNHCACRKIDLADVVRDSETNKEIIRGLINRINKLEELCDCSEVTNRKIKLGESFKFATKDNPQDSFDLADGIIVDKIIEAFDLLGNEASTDALVVLSGEEKDKIIPVMLYNNLAAPDVDNLNRSVWLFKLE